MPIEIGATYRASPGLAGGNDAYGVCVLAAGLAKRLEPISEVIAKPAFPLAGRVPIAELWVRKFVDAGLRRVAMNLHRVPESIRGYFGDGQRFMADLTYVHEETPSGTLGGAIKMVRALQQQGFNPQRVFVPSGDIVSNIGVEHLQRMAAAHAEHGAVVTLMLAPVPWERRSDFGTAILDGVPAGSAVPPGTFAQILEFREKDPESPSNENNASNYLIDVDFLLELEPYLTAAQPGLAEPCYDFAKHVFMAMVGKVPHLGFLTRFKDRLYGYEPGTLWFDVGNKRDYLEVNKAVLNRQIPLDPPYNQYPWGWMGENVEIDFNRVAIRGPVVIGHGCTIFPGAEIGPNVVLGDGWTCHKGSKIKDAVFWPYYDFTGPAHGSPGARISRIREVREGVTIDTAIVVAGIIAADIHAKTVDALPDGDLDIRGIDWVPAGSRA
jgi:NDP-sugar pyrophosphorylase family protein